MTYLKPIKITLWVVITSGFLFCIFHYLIHYLIFSQWPPHWYELKQRRKILQNKVATLGGWDLIRTTCDKYMEEKFTNIVNLPNIYSRHQNIALPEILEKLNPSSIQLYPHPYNTNLQPAVLKVTMYERIHSTGGRGSKYYGFHVVSDKFQGDFPVPSNDYPTFFNTNYTFRKVAERVYESY